MTAITLENVKKSYDGHEVLKGINLSVPKNSITGIMGKSGIGKTTLLRIIAGFEAMDEGTLNILGSDVLCKLEPSKRGVAYVFQEAALWNHMSVEKNISYCMGDIPKKEKEQHIKEIADWLKISSLLKKRPFELSGGEAKRVSIARAYASDKPVILLDEPLANLDDELKEEILTSIKENSKNKTLLYVTHNKEELEKLGAKIYTIRDGFIDEN